LLVLGNVKDNAAVSTVGRGESGKTLLSADCWGCQKL